jgi:SIR2-like domain
MLLVILGAGSSYDSAPTHHPKESPDLPDRPPLADALFENRPIFREAMRRFPAIQPIIPLLQRRHGRSLEQQLQVLASEADVHPARAQQLMAVRYYIQYILRRTEHAWLYEVTDSVTNFKSMLDELDRCTPKGHAVPIVSFNYDRLVEDALRSRGTSIALLDDYIANDRFKLFKVHGSIDWVHSTGIKVAEFAESLNQWGAVAAVTERAPKLTLGKEFLIAAEDYPSGMLHDELVAPALAIPLEDKTDFECPQEHLTLLTSLLREASSILIIGWRATENHFLRLLTENAPLATSVFIACGTIEEGEATSERLRRAGLQAHFHVSSGGFTDLVTKREYTSFLQAVICR